VDGGFIDSLGVVLLRLFKKLRISNMQLISLKKKVSLQQKNGTNSHQMKKKTNAGTPSINSYQQSKNSLELELLLQQKILPLSKI
jgi:hypothetical protein